MSGLVSQLVLKGEVIAQSEVYEDDTLIGSSTDAAPDVTLNGADALTTYSHTVATTESEGALTAKMGEITLGVSTAIETAVGNHNDENLASAVAYAYFTDVATAAVDMTLNFDPVFAGSVFSDPLNNSPAFATGEFELTDVTSAPFKQVAFQDVTLDSTEPVAQQVSLTAGHTYELNVTVRAAASAQSYQGQNHDGSVTLDTAGALLQELDADGHPIAGNPDLQFASGYDYSALACFAAGTRILTDRGPVPVEALRAGDLVASAFGALRRVRWIGHRRIDCRRWPRPEQAWPVRVRAGTFGDLSPLRDLLLSPDHAVFVNDVLIPIRHLINGSTIAQVPVDRVTYHHIELAEHDVLLAEGLPAESFLDLRDGTNYANRPGPIRLYPDYPARMWEAFGCARLVVTGPELEAARALVAGVATIQAAA